MTPEQKQIALTALRSGNYRQYREGVVNKNRTAFCCIGVMAVAMGHNRFLDTETAAKECGVGDETSIPLSKALIHLNDTAKWDFNRIADFLEVAV